MYERFTDRARKIMATAKQVAKEYNHTVVGTEHVLIALARENTGISAQAIKNLGFIFGIIEQKTIELLSKDEPKQVEDITNTPTLNKVLEQAFAAAKDLHHNYVGTEHLLLGLVHPKTRFSIAHTVLEQLGLTYEVVSREIRNILGEGLQEKVQAGELTSKEAMQELQRRGNYSNETMKVCEDLHQVAVHNLIPFNFLSQMGQVHHQLQTLREIANICKRWELNLLSADEALSSIVNLTGTSNTG